MRSNNYLELIDLYEDLVDVVYEIGTLTSRTNKNDSLRYHLLERRTELLGEIEDQRDRLLINQMTQQISETRKRRNTRVDMVGY